jgi:DNA-binding XRE family transcriptional regulator
MNPLKQLRLQSHLTQQELADKIGVTRQTVIDTEQGLFPVIPPSIAQTCSHEVQKLYRDWVRQERQLNTGRFAVKLDHVHDFQDYCEAVGGSTRGFARVLVIQTSIVRDYISKGERWGMIEAALSETGVPVEMIEWLKKLDRG